MVRYYARQLSSNVLMTELYICLSRFVFRHYQCVCVHQTKIPLPDRAFLRLSLIWTDSPQPSLFVRSIARAHVVLSTLRSTSFQRTSSKPELSGRNSQLVGGKRGFWGRGQPGGSSRWVAGLRNTVYNVPEQLSITLPGDERQYYPRLMADLEGT